MALESQTSPKDKLRQRVSSAKEITDATALKRELADALSEYNTATQAEAVIQPEAIPSQPQQEGEQKEYRLLTPGQMKGVAWGLYIADESADPTQSIIEPGTGKRFRRTSQEEKNQMESAKQRGLISGASPFQTEATPAAPTDTIEQPPLTVDELRARLDGVRPTLVPDAVARLEQRLNELALDDLEGRKVFGRDLQQAIDMASTSRTDDNRRREQLNNRSSAGELDQRFGADNRRNVVTQNGPVTFWVDGLDDSARLIREGNPFRIAAGGTYNFGSGANLDTKKWTGQLLGWQDALAQGQGFQSADALADMQLRNPEAYNLYQQLLNPDLTKDAFFHKVEEFNVAQLAGPPLAGTYHQSAPAQIKPGRTLSIKIFENGRISFEAQDITPEVQPSPPVAQPGPTSPQQSPEAPAPLGTAVEVQHGPSWSGQYFNGVPGGTWRKFDVARFADVKPLSVEELRRNHGQLWGEIMIAVDPIQAEHVTDLLVRRIPLDRDSEKFVEFAQFELSTVLQRFEPIEKKFDAKMMERLFSTREDLRALVTLNGIDHTLAEYKKEMLHAMVHGKRKGEAFLENFNKLTEREGTARGQRMERKTQELCSKLNIPRANYQMLVVPGDRRATQENLQNYIHQRAGRFRKWIDRIEASSPIALNLPGSSSMSATWNGWRAARNAPPESKWYSPRSWATSDIIEARADVGEFLALTVSTPEFREGLQHYAFYGETSTPVTRQGPLTISEARQRGAEQMSLPNAQRMFNRDIQQHAIASGYQSAAAMPVAERQNFRDNLWNPADIYEHGESRGLGFLSLIARALSRLLFAERKKQVSVENIT